MATTENTPSNRKSLTERTEDELAIESFDEVESPEADIVSLGDASYTKMLGKIYA
ncbi:MULTISPECIES: hypothetical protein [Streptomyces]|jgi:hypothetical protein|uniref:Uncharacterized protein n=1 Tax=Streptomyces kurssanovii TaxID=67312 RepID=A0ABV3HZ93_9ACTN